MHTRRLARLLPLLPLVCLVAGQGCSSRPTRSARDPLPGEKAFQVLTYNVNFGLGGSAEGIEAIRNAGADLVLLQETTAEWQSAIERELAGEYPYMAFHHVRGGAGGLGVLSRAPFTDAGVLPAESWFPAWNIHAETPIGTLQVLNVHLRPGFGDKGGIVSGYFTTPEIREREITAFLKELDDDLPTLVVGDFNEDEDGRALKKLAAEGFRTALPEFDPKAKTWRWPTSVGNLTGRLDHVVYDESLEPLSVEVLDQGRSDHLPVLAVFAVAK